MRVNFTKKDLINSLYMQIGFSKKISSNLLDDILMTIIENLKINDKLKISKFGTFTKRLKKSRQGRNPITKENKLISTRNVILFKASKEFKYLVNLL
jgi:integration host factor subunit alpha